MSKSKRKSGRMCKYHDDILWMREKRHKAERERAMSQQVRDIRRSVKNLAERANNVGGDVE